MKRYLTPLCILLAALAFTLIGYAYQHDTFTISGKAVSISDWHPYDGQCQSYGMVDRSQVHKGDVVLHHTWYGVDKTYLVLSVYGHDEVEASLVETKYLPTDGRLLDCFGYVVYDSTR